jgi:esterase/lipase
MEEKFFLESGGSKISCLSNIPENAENVVILCHGFASSKNSSTNRALTQLLNKEKIGTLAFDFFSHEESEGEFSDLTIDRCVDNLEEVVNYANKRFDRVGVIGSSFGGLISLIVSSRVSSKIDFLALKSPTVDFSQSLENYFGKEKMSEWKNKGVIEIDLVGKGKNPIKYNLFENLKKYDVYQLAREINIPVFIVHGEKDELVDYNQSVKLTKYLKGKNKIFIIPSADHRFSNPEHFELMIQNMVTWVKENLKTKT